MRTRVIAATIAVVSGFALSGCGLVDLGPKPPKAAPTPAGGYAIDGPSAEPSAATSASSVPPAAGPGVRSGDTSIGRVLATAKGATLYRFDKDSAKPPKTTCYGACAAKWPAYPWTENMRLDGVDPALVGKVQRTDGSWQLTIAGWPAYTFTGDSAAGDVNGHGTGSTWWAFAPDGKKVPPVADSGGGY